MVDGRARKAKSGERCPVCGKPPVASERPFCSRGCKDRDLLKWLDGGYRIEGPSVPVSVADDAADEQ